MAVEMSNEGKLSISRHAAAWQGSSTLSNIDLTVTGHTQLYGPARATMSINCELEIVLPEMQGPAGHLISILATYHHHEA
jgi:hypothetical protein